MNAARGVGQAGIGPILLLVIGLSVVFLSSPVLLPLIGADAWATEVQGDASTRMEPGAPSWVVSRSPDFVVLSFTETPGELSNGEPALLVEVHGDGRVVVDRPRHSKRQGRYRAQLSSLEFEALMEAMVVNGVVDFDAKAVHERRRDASRAVDKRTVTLFSESDPSTIEVRFNLAEYAPGGRGVARQRDVARRIRWQGLRGDARRHPDLQEIQGLQRAVSRLRGIAQRADLERID